MSKIIPIINDNKGNITIEEPNLPTLESKSNKNLIPYLDDNDNLILQMNGVGPMGPKGERGEKGNGILRIEKTNTEDLIDYYTIYFTNGETFEYSITNGVIHYYEGDYEVTPMAYTVQILSTENMAMRNNIIVNEIPYSEVSNLSGGVTATIGDIN